MNHDYSHLEEKFRKERKRKRKISKTSGTLSGQMAKMKISRGYVKKH